MVTLAAIAPAITALALMMRAHRVPVSDVDRRLSRLDVALSR